MYIYNHDTVYSCPDNLTMIACRLTLDRFDICVGKRI
jgi:hypothetical protein